MPLKRRDVEAALEQKGFQRREGDHSFFNYYAEDGRKTIVFTKTSHGTSYKDIGDVLVSRMAKQCKISSAEFRKFVDCSLSRQDYERKLIELGLI